MLTKLNRMEGYLHPIAKLQNSTLAEIRCYTWPPEVVRNVLAAVYVLLGEDYEYLQVITTMSWYYLRIFKVGVLHRMLFRVSRICRFLDF